METTNPNDETNERIARAADDEVERGDETETTPPETVPDDVGDASQSDNDDAQDSDDRAPFERPDDDESRP